MSWQWKGWRAFLGQRDWFISGGLILLIYVIMLMVVGFYAKTPGVYGLLIHLLPLLAGACFLFGWLEKKEREERERERRQKRYQVRMFLSRQSRAEGSAGPVPLSGHPDKEEKK